MLFFLITFKYFREKNDEINLILDYLKKFIPLFSSKRLTKDQIYIIGYYHIWNKNIKENSITENIASELLLSDLKKFRDIIFQNSVTINLYNKLDFNKKIKLFIYLKRFEVIKNWTNSQISQAINNVDILPTSKYGKDLDDDFWNL